MGVPIDYESWVPPPAKDVKKNVLQRLDSEHTRTCRVRWTVDGKKLKSRDTEAVSPNFELGDNNFMMLLRPRMTGEVKGGACFKKARGRGTVELKCLDTISWGSKPTVTFRIYISSPALAGKRQPPRGPVVHDFAQRAICGLPKGHDEWNFSQVVDKDTGTFVVVLEVIAAESTDAP